MNPSDADVDSADRLNDLIVAVGRDRDRAAFQALFTHFAPRLKAFMQGQRIDAGLAEEIVQETMVNVWRKAAQFDPSKASAATWFFAIARNMRVDLLRKARRPEPDMDDPALVPDAEPLAHELISREQEAARLKQAFADLPQDQQEVLNLVYMEDQTHAQVAESLGIPLGTVKSRIRLALKRMRSDVGERE